LIGVGTRKSTNRHWAKSCHEFRYYDNLVEVRELIDQGMRVSGKRVARLMRVNAIRGVSRRPGFIVTTGRDERQRPAPDLVKREFITNSQTGCGLRT
jgi:hypothetical protein